MTTWRRRCNDTAADFISCASGRSMTKQIQCEKARPLLTINGVSLSRPMTLVMIQHINGSRPLRIEDRETIRALRARGLIYFNRNVRPTKSFITGKGREVISALLASQADSLMSTEVVLAFSNPG